MADKVLDSNFAGYSGKDVAGVLNAFARLNHFPDRLFSAASRHLTEMPSTEYISEKDLGLIFNAFARAGIADQALFESLAPRVISQISSLSSQSCGNICHALGKLGVEGEATATVVPKLCERILKIKTASNQELSNVFHSLARLGFTDSDLLEPLVRLIAKRIHAFNAVEVAAIATGVSKLNLADRELMNNMRKCMEKNINAFSSYELTAVLHAFSQVEVATPVNLFEQAESKIFEGCHPHTACIALCAFGRVGITPNEALAVTLANEVRSERSPQYLVDVLFGLSRIQPLSSPLLDLTDWIGKKLRDGFPETPVNVNQLIFGISKLRVNNPSRSLEEVYMKSLEIACKLVKSFDELQVTNLLHALGTSSSLSDAERKIAESLSKRVGDINNPQMFASCLESISRLDIRSPSVWNTVERRLKVVIPDSPVYDVKIAQTLAHVGKFREHIANIILKRINLDKLSVSSTLALLYTLLHARVGSLGHLQAIANHLQSNLAVMSVEQFRDASSLLQESGVNIVPFQYIKTPKMVLTSSPLEKVHGNKDPVESGSFLAVSECIKKALLKSPNMDIERLVNEMERANSEHAPDCVAEALGDCLLDRLQQEKPKLDTLCRVIPLLIPEQKRDVAKQAVRAMEEGDVPHDWPTLGILLQLESPELRNLVLAVALPSLVKASTKAEILNFMSSHTHLFSP